MYMPEPWATNHTVAPYNQLLGEPMQRELRDAIKVLDQAEKAIKDHAEVVKFRSKQHQRDFVESVLEMQVALCGIQSAVAKLQLFELTRDKKNELERAGHKVA